MKIEEFKELDKKINQQTFKESYKNFNIILNILSYLGNVASVFLSYFLLSKVFYNVFSDNFFVVLITSVIILGGLELIKRDVFDKFSILYIKTKKLTKEVMPLFLVSLFVISITFYASINGSKEFSHKEKVYETEKNTIAQKYSDSITNLYQTKIVDIEKEIKDNKVSIEGFINKKLEYEQSDVKRRDKERMFSDFNNEINNRREFIIKLENDINLIKTERDNIIKTKKDELEKVTSEKKDENSSNSLIFIVLSVLIEIVILIGVYFNEYYKYKSYKEFKEFIENDKNYQKWFIYSEILNIIYLQDLNENKKLMPIKNIISMCKNNGLIVSQKDIMDFNKLLTSLGVIRVSGNSKYINKEKEKAVSILKEHYGIQ